MKKGGILAKSEKDQIGFKEFFSVIIIGLSTKASDMTTGLLFKEGLNAAWMIVIGSFLLILPSILILTVVLKKYQSKDLLEVTQLTLGKTVAVIIGSMLLFFTVINIAVDSRSYMTQLTTINYPKTPLFIFYLCFLIVCIWCAKKGLESLGAIAWIVTPLTLFSGIFLIVLMLREATFLRIFPLFGSGKWEIAKASFTYIALFTDAFIFTMMYPFVKNHQTYTRSLFSGLLVAVFFMVMLYLSYVLMFDYRSIGQITYPFHTAIRSVSLGRAISNIETFFITVWLLFVFVKFSFYIYVACKIFGFIFQINEFEHTIIPITLLILVIGMLPENDVVNVFVIRKNTLVYYKYIILLLPLLLWTAMKMKGARAQ